MEKTYLPSQILMLMPGDLYKVASTLFAYQKDGEITYSKRNAEYLHLDQAVAEQCVQTLVDIKLIEPLEQAGGVWKFKINKPLIEVAKGRPLTEIPNKPLIKLSEAITWKEQATTKERTANEILGEIERLKKELMAKVKEDNNKTDELPW